GCKSHLLRVGILEDNITSHDIDGTLTESDALLFDVIFFTGGETPYLANQMKKFNFDKIVKAMVYANRVYVGISAGSMIASKNFYLPFDYQPSPEEFTGLGLTDICITVHCVAGTPSRDDLSSPHFSLTDRQAIVIKSNGYTLIDV
ncbi:MAG: Type 1 glutamine amidotransferase-like domain-containing protein, partial [Defluviitaleaceae bacterium]|nr:Type 1 glutamine amidotransferase-like domain-containing protein [Defluviitaleaceae bacterium]